MATQIIQYIIGTVTNANDHGIKLDTDSAHWLNVSKFADPAPTIPPVGARVRVGMDAKGFVRTIESAAPSAAPIDEPWSPTAAPGYDSKGRYVEPDDPPDFAHIEYFDDLDAEPRGQHVAEMRERVANERPATREEVITRLACLKAATHLAVTALPADMDAVTMTDATLRIADRLEAWATRPA